MPHRGIGIKHRAAPYERQVQIKPSPKGAKAKAMAQSLSKVYVHIIFSTKHRQNFIDDNIKASLIEYLGGICRELECSPVIGGDHQNHMHILNLLSRKIEQMKLLKELKKGSSKWMKTKGASYSSFYWQDGYGIFSVNPFEIDTVTEYIKNQEEHHLRRGFKDEYRIILKKFKVEYDERYVWD